MVLRGLYLSQAITLTGFGFCIFKKKYDCIIFGRPDCISHFFYLKMAGDAKLNREIKWRSASSAAISFSNEPFTKKAFRFTRRGQGKMN
jgi:hypothetical protein